MVFQGSMKEESLRKGPWLEEEDEKLVTFVTLLGGRRWDSLARASRLRRSGKSCRLRWLNYLRRSLKHGRINEEEKQIILQLHSQWDGPRLPGRTDNEIKNYFRTHLRRKANVQEQDRSSSTRDGAKEDFLHQRDSTEIGTQNCNAEDSVGTADQTSDNPCIAPHLADISSPYEARISEWLSQFPTDQSDLKPYEDSSSADSLLSKAEWTSECSDIWEISCSLWT